MSKILVKRQQSKIVMFRMKHRNGTVYVEIPSVTFWALLALYNINRYKIVEPREYLSHLNKNLKNTGLLNE